MLTSHSTILFYQQRLFSNAADGAVTWILITLEKAPPSLHKCLQAMSCTTPIREQANGDTPKDFEVGVSNDSLFGCCDVTEGQALCYPLSCLLC